MTIAGSVENDKEVSMREKGYTPAIMTMSSALAE